MPSSDLRVPASSAPSRSGSRFVPQEEIGSIATWQFDRVAPDDEAPDQSSPGLSPDEWEALITQRERDAWRRGFEEGERLAGERLAEDVARSKQAFIESEGRDWAHRLAGLIDQAEQSLLQVQEGIAAQVLEIACATARQVVRRELLIDPKALRPTIDEAVEQLLLEAKVVTVRLAAHDHALLAGDIRSEFPSGQVDCIVDPTLAPGDCIAQAAGVQIDGTMESRWRHAVERLGSAQAWMDGDGSDSR